MCKRKSSQSGFSMVEMLVAVVILAIGLLGLAELQVTAMKANSQGESLTAASALAQRAIEEVVARAPSDAIFNTAVTDQPWPGGTGVTVAGGGTYDITYSIALNHEGVANLCRVTVTVTSTSALMHVGVNRVRSVSTSTFKRVN